jgi:hypothetical protein
MSTINISGGISKKLKTLFPSYTVYTEDQSQGTDQEDAFYILHSLSISPDVSGRVWLHALVTIRATRMPSDGRKRGEVHRECHDEVLSNDLVLKVFCTSGPVVLD